MRSGKLLMSPGIHAVVRAILSVVAAALLAVAVVTSPALADGNFGGIGIDGVPLDDGQILVRQLVAGGPAHLAGVRTGDIITHIDSKATRGSDFRWMVERRLKGRPETPVTLTIRRPGEEKPLHFTMQRRKLVVPSRGTSTKGVDP
jgi:C-terminal processing protease CtpA/Prc